MNVAVHIEQRNANSVLIGKVGVTGEAAVFERSPEGRGRPDAKVENHERNGNAIDAENNPRE